VSPLAPGSTWLTAFGRGTNAGMLRWGGGTADLMRLSKTLLQRVQLPHVCNTLLLCTCSQVIHQHAARKCNTPIAMAHVLDWIHRAKQ
jgi:hypothetical protein